MLSEMAAEHARELRALLADRTLGRIGAVDLGGDVSAERVSDGGARFVLRLPIVPAPSGAPEAVADPR